MSALQDFLSWWIGQLRDILPQNGQAGGRGPALIAELPNSGDAIRLLLRRGDRETALGPLDAARVRNTLTTRRGRQAARRTLLRVPKGTVLERTVTLPLATEAMLDRVLGYELDRISPFAPDEAAWTYATERRDRATGQVHVQVALLPLARLGPALAELRQAGLAASVALAPRPGGGTWRFELTPPGQRAAAPWRRPALAVAATICLVLAAASMATPLLVQQARLDRADATIEQLRPTIAAVEALRRNIAAGAGAGDAVGAEAARLGDALSVIASLTALLPDDTYLTALSIRKRVLTLSGRSSQAARLIPLLSADPSLHNTTFAAPVTRVEGTDGDQFSIRAEVGS